MALSQHGAEVVIFNRLLIYHAKLAPPLLASFTLHLVFVDSGLGVEVREVFHEVVVDIVVMFREPQGRASHLFEDFPVCEHVLNSFDSELLLDLHIFVSDGARWWDEWHSHLQSYLPSPGRSLQVVVR